MNIKKEIMILIVALVYSIATLLALPNMGSVAYIPLGICSYAIGLFSAIFLIIITARFILDKTRNEQGVKEFEGLLDGISLQSAILIVAGALLTLTAFLNQGGMLSLLPLCGMLVFFLGTSQVPAISCSDRPICGC